MLRQNIYKISLWVRAWWWSKKADHERQKHMPADVRNFILQRSTKAYDKAIHANLSPQERLRIYEQLSGPLFGSDDWRQWGITEETINIMTGVAMKYLASVPSGNCIKCDRPIFIHEAIMTGAGYLCTVCGSAA
jgi:hypothetical protein